MSADDAAVQVQQRVNESSDVSSDEARDDDDDDNDAENTSSNDNVSPAEHEDTGTSDRQQSQPATDRLSESQSSDGLTVTPIKIKCPPKRIRTMARILHLKNNQRHRRPQLTKNVSSERRSFGSLSGSLSPTATPDTPVIRKVRGRPKGSKNKVKKWPWLQARQSQNNEQNKFQLATDTLDVGRFSLTECPQTAVEDYGEPFEEVNCNHKSAKQTFWRPPTDANSRRVLDQISITDVTANALTVTVRESAIQDGFFGL